MTSSWKEVKARKHAADLASGRDLEAARSQAAVRTQAYVIGDHLARLRERAGLTQAQLAERMNVSQPRISKLEQGDPDQLMLETLRRYVTALGGQLRIVADFEDDGMISTSQLDINDSNVVATG